ncbi:hypothetical protein P8C59_002969 [Phyllachora maydis]|uniref:Glycosyltransferase 2-like domain-containing protein n=1 Tax=Phyllachora maydis TaxID=1825666 RepID=A0AAD9M9V0_9PEZI|nr:hypothetical protein P8C59_002969 [Phyllachora maydis]
MMVNWLYEQQVRKQYASCHNPFEGVVLKKTRGNYTCCPPHMAALPASLFTAVCQMNVRCAMTVNTPAIHALLISLTRETNLDHVPLPNGLQVQILPSIAHLPRSKLHHFAAFIQDVRMLVVWDDEPEKLLARAQRLEALFIDIIWRREASSAGPGHKKGLLHLSAEKLDAERLEEAPPAIVGNVFQIFGPVSGVSSNSKYYSGRPPARRLDCSVQPLPHVTFQLPVYKEGLGAVIKPTVMSLKAAISTYEMQGGTANIFVNDDGMQLLDEASARARRDFYDEHHIGWVARPAHRPHPRTEAGEARFLRRGKFKKASNMNYALHVANRVEEKLAAAERSPQWTADHELSAYYRCLGEVLQEDEGRTWAEGNIRVGDYILLIDSDTRVPFDCLLDAVSEMEQAPEVALIQFRSDVMNVTTSYFERGVTWFTRYIYTAITFAVASGDSAPFVGHNAMLRWSAMQHAAAYEDEDGYEKYWSESHVSEDFDMSLRLQVQGYSIRFAAYTGDGFKEGVSLTVYDELARWEKFLFSSIPLARKLTIIAYIGTYYAIAAAWIVVILNYFITGWYYGAYDKYYLDSFAIYLAIMSVFTGLGNLSLAVLRFRMKEESLITALLQNLKWIPMLMIFLGGISIHVSQAILSHFFEVDMVWGSTAKEVENVNFGQEMVRILGRFRWTFLFCAAGLALILCGFFAFPEPWRIRTFFSIYPLASVLIPHFCLPVLLNPALMMFTW